LLKSDFAINLPVVLWIMTMYLPCVAWGFNSA